MYHVHLLKDYYTCGSEPSVSGGFWQQQAVRRVLMENTLGSQSLVNLTVHEDDGVVCPDESVAVKEF